MDKILAKILTDTGYYECSDPAEVSKHLTEDMKDLSKIMAIRTYLTNIYRTDLSAEQYENRTVLIDHLTLIAAEKAAPKYLEEIASTSYMVDKVDGCYRTELYADYRDELSSETAVSILDANDPESYFYEKLFEIYEDEEWRVRDEIVNEVKEKLDRDYPGFVASMKDEAAELLAERVYELLDIEYPEDHYLDQAFPCNIFMDTGDANYDFTLNCRYPSTGDLAFFGREEAMGPIDDRASIVWLAKTQGYSKGQLRKALNQGDMANPKGFLQSMRVEMANTSTSMLMVAFLIELTLRQLLTINSLLKYRKPSTSSAYATKNPDCGYITIGKETECGLFDPWDGAGGPFEIELEKDIKIQLRDVRSCLPDTRHGNGGYTVNEVYGMCGSAWRDTLKEIHIPTRLRKEVLTCA